MRGLRILRQTSPFGARAARDKDGGTVEVKVDGAFVMLSSADGSRAAANATTVKIGPNK